MTAPLPTYGDIEAAAKRIASHTIVTPLLRSPELDALTGGTVLLKAEMLQRTGSFKFRGAFNRLTQLTPEQKAAGVVAFSSGNHAQGVAAAAKILGMKATIIMPADAPAIKLANTKAYGAEVVTYDRVKEDREEIARRVANGRVIVPAYDDPYILTGQGTLGLEAMNQAKAMGLTVDSALAPASGGGLISGVGLAVHHANPTAKIYTVEPAGYDDHKRSVESGKRERNASLDAALCDALLAVTPGEITWAINSKALAGGYAVTDAQVRHAIGYAFRTLKLVVEPGGAVGLAAILAGLHDTKGRCTLVVLSGGNIDPAIFAECLTL